MPTKSADATKTPRLHADLLRDAEQRSRDETHELREKLYKRVARSPERIEDLVLGMETEEPPVKYGCSAILRMVSERKPELLGDRWKFFVQQLKNDSPFLRWEAMHLASNLAGVVDKRRADGLVDKLAEPISGPVLVSAANAIAGLARLAALKPKCTEKAVDAILLVGRSRFTDADDKNIAVGHAITALGAIYEQLDDTARVLRFVRRHRENARPETQQKAERFLERHAARRARG